MLDGQALKLPGDRKGRSPDRGTLLVEKLAADTFFGRA
jgi:hypothetical protein